MAQRPSTTFGFMTDTKHCPKCNNTKPISEFRIRGEGKTKQRIYTICKSCEKIVNKITSDLRKSAPPKPNVCDCCKKPTTKFVLDHDHQTSKFRGWLCDGCNIGISRLGDTQEGVKKAYDYLSS
jgi:hypothetical protein